MGALKNYFTGGGAGLDLISQGIQLGSNYLQGLMNQHFEEKSRESNFKWNEKAAKEADKRQRAQYMDLYSPEAMMQQYKAAGLSPSMMFSGAGSVGGAASSNMSAGVSGPSSYPSGGSPLQGIQMANLMEDTEGRQIDNAMKEIAKNLQEIQKTKLEWENKLLMTYFYDEKGNRSSLGDYAKNAKSFEDFKKTIAENQNLDDMIKQYINTENGEQTLRAIYKSRHELDNDIAVLSSSKMNAQVMEKVSRLLYNSEYAEQNRDATLSNLKQISESADLTATQKESMNNLIEKLGDGTFKDIMVVILMILSNYQHAQIKLNTGGQSFVTNNTENNW